MYSDKEVTLPVPNSTVKVTVDNFIADPKNVKADPYVGYRMFDNDSLLIAGYTFKYLSELSSQDLYLQIGGLESDSVLYVGEKLAFAIDTVKTADLANGSVNTTPENQNFGYTPTSTSTGKTLSGWANLKRRAYTLKVKGSEDRYVVLDEQGRYAVSSKVSWASNSDNRPVRFYLKANNAKDGEVYYTLVDLATRYSTAANYETPKGGVDDNAIMLSISELNTKRTSAFAISHDDTPLYRRFANDPAEGAYANGDGPDTMRFYEKYRKEYLQMESNPSFTVAGIDFLGINAKSEAKGGISFIVDSAWIGRGLGYIKPQYLISIDRNDQPAVDAIPCPEEFHGNAPDGTPYDQWTCPHATKGTPGFNRGRYLINFEFPGYGVKDDAENDYVWKKFYRAGFVEAVHMGDSLYILRDEFAGLPNNRIDTAAIKAAEAAWRKA
ncbi:MAG: hypothetical protein LUG51_02270, partial [Tannerellaceae bacterium]|nr:hypothetical protein [Tannerellaceae bacterium]